MDLKIKRFLIFQIVIIIIVSVLGQLGKAAMPNCGIQDVKTIEQIYDLDISLTSFFKDEDYDNLVYYQEEYVSDIEAAPIVAIVKPTGNVHAYNYIYCQEVTVEKVIQGDKNLENMILPIYNTSKFCVSIDNDRLAYCDLSNIMQLEHSYLAFFSPLELNDYYERDVYRFFDSFFCYLDLDSNSTIPITTSSGSVDFREVKNIEFFADSQRTVDTLLEIKQQIIDKYIN